ncbi:MAG: S-adenosylmethionine decarboxylase family protein [Pyrinomonadaceae bacterium]
MIVGTEWLIEAHDCDRDALRDEAALRGVFLRIIDELGLKAVGDIWHKFPGMGGVTGMVALTESHLACHTYPEHGIATFNLYCCRTRPEWDWERHLKEMVGAGEVKVIKIERGSSRSDLKEFEMSDPRSQISDVRAEIDEDAPEKKFQIAGGDN